MLVLIDILVVGWFQSFKTPLTIMAAIPFSLVGILPAHGLMGAFFTATSMIGFIAGAGIVVRNSIILVDFIELRLKQGMPLAEAVIDAGAVRFRPMMLTAAAIIPVIGIVGSAVDIGRAYMAQLRLQQACDAGVLAGRRAMAGGSYGDPQKAEANKMFNFNYPTGMYGSTGISFSSVPVGTSSVGGTAAGAGAGPLGRESAAL